jgi:hypothetical protein
MNLQMLHFSNISIATIAAAVSAGLAAGPARFCGECLVIA